MGNFCKILESHEFLKSRREYSLESISKIRKEFKEDLDNENITIFSAGSLGREEVGKNSDLDTFLLSNKKINRLDRIKIYSKLIDANDKLGYPEISNSGEHLKIHEVEDIKKNLGSPDDDKENMFTERMLLLLESKYLYNKHIYDEILEEIISLYFRDEEGIDNFKPLFLINDILRYWRTICLNYEQTRHDEKRKWKKKNINLKYSRLLTIFSTVFAIISKPINTKEEVLELCKMAPLRRLALGLDNLEDSDLKEKFSKILDIYSYFLKAKEEYDLEKAVGVMDQLNKDAIVFSNFIYEIVNHKEIEKEYRKYLII